MTHCCSELGEIVRAGVRKNEETAELLATKQFEMNLKLSSNNAKVVGIIAWSRIMAVLCRTRIGFE